MRIRSSTLLGVPLALSLTACASSPDVRPESALSVSTLEARATALEAENQRQAEQISLLRGQLALAQAEVREARARERETPRETVRIGGAQPAVVEQGWIEHESPVAATASAAPEPPTPPRSNDEGERPVLRLHGVGAMPLIGSPAVRESLPVGPAAPPSVASVVGVTPPAAMPFPPAQQAPQQLPPVVLGTPAPSDSQAARESYRVALGHVTARRFEQAVPALSAFIDRFPGHPYVDNALFWRATASYAMRRYDASLADFQRVVAEYPNGNKVADALLQIGMCYQRLGDTARARAYFERVRREFPQSVAARLAAREDTT